MLNILFYLITIVNVKIEGIRSCLKLKVNDLVWNAFLKKVLNIFE
jgi:hypothetical protein